MYKKVYIYYYLLVFTLGEEVGEGEGGAGIKEEYTTYIHQKSMVVKGVPNKQEHTYIYIRMDYPTLKTTMNQPLSINLSLVGSNVK